MSRASVQKGKKAEREVANLVRDLLKEEHGLEVQMSRKIEQSRDGGFDLDGLPYMAVEVKRREKLSLGAWWKQTCEQAEPLRLIPVLAYRLSRQEWKFVLPLSLVIDHLYPPEWEYYGDKELMILDIHGFTRICADNVRHYLAVVAAEKPEKERRTMN